MYPLDARVLQTACTDGGGVDTDMPQKEQQRDAVQPSDADMIIQAAPVAFCGKLQRAGAGVPDLKIVVHAHFDLEIRDLALGVDALHALQYVFFHALTHHTVAVRLPSCTAV